MRGDELDLVRGRLAELGRAPTPADVAEAMRRHGLVVSDAVLVSAMEQLRRDSIGAGPLDPLLRLDGVTDVLVNGAGEVYFERGNGIERSSITFSGEDEVRRLAARLAASVGRRLDDGMPYVDARLADGTRVHAILSALADPGTCLSLRVPSRVQLTLDDWVAGGGLPPGGAQILRALIAGRAAFLVCGGTGSGKTTLLATLLGLVPENERLVIVEDSRELAPAHGHCVRLESRPANAEGAGAITLTELVRQALRMRPDRLALGEVRGAELCDLLTSLNTGHEGGCGTIHANSAADVPARLEALAALGGMGRDALQAQAAAGLDAVVAVQRQRDHRGQAARRITGIGVLQRQSGELEVQPAATFDEQSVRYGPGAGALERLCSR